jgi:hypothetical protein
VLIAEVVESVQEKLIPNISTLFCSVNAGMVDIAKRVSDLELVLTNWAEVDSDEPVVFDAASVCGPSPPPSAAKSSAEPAGLAAGRLPRHLPTS